MEAHYTEDSTYYSPDMVKYPLSTADLDILMTGQPAFHQTKPTYEASDVDNGKKYISNILIDHMLFKLKKKTGLIFIPNLAQFPELFFTQQTNQTPSKQS